MSDPYLDPLSGILRNRFDSTNQEALDRAEANSVLVRSTLLQLNTLNGNFDSEHLKQIHSHLFRDVYDWAGQFRTIPLAKADSVHSEQLTKFTLSELIEEELNKVFRQLAEKYLAGLQRREFARKVAALLSEINRIHPFREGNGRAQRQFVRQLADSVGHKLHFAVVSKERLIQASIQSAQRGDGHNGTFAGRDNGHGTNPTPGKSDCPS